MIMVETNQIVETDMGFFHVVTTDGFTIQCCLEVRKDGNGYKKSINRNDCGYDDGICGDVNEGAFRRYGKTACLNTLLSIARKHGIKVRS